jgi:monofunctional biosynthetic peptidoglycan transglycosylase
LATRDASGRESWRRTALRIAALLLLCAAALQAAFALRIAAMRFADPASTAFQRSEAWRLLRQDVSLPTWRRQWVDLPRISTNLQRAVIASEDADFARHGGVDWASVQAAWERNQRTRARLPNDARTRSGHGATASSRLVGGSTISQQLAKNLFLSGERTLARKAQEFVITLMLEALLPKRRLLEIYLNSVEWGEGIFGAEAAAQRHFRTAASRLTPQQAARLAVMLPAPKRHEKQIRSSYLDSRSATIVARMGAIDLP